MQLGVECKVAPAAHKQLKALTYHVYWESHERSVNGVRFNLLKKMVGVDQTLNYKSKVDMVC